MIIGPKTMGHMLAQFSRAWSDGSLSSLETALDELHKEESFLSKKREVRVTLTACDHEREPFTFAAKATNPLFPENIAHGSILFYPQMPGNPYGAHYKIVFAGDYKGRNPNRQ